MIFSKVFNPENPFPVPFRQMVLGLKLGFVDASMWTFIFPGNNARFIWVCRSAMKSVHDSRVCRLTWVRVMPDLRRRLAAAAEGDRASIPSSERGTTPV